MWKDSIRNIVVIFQPNILRIVGFYVRHSAIVVIFQTNILRIVGFYVRHSAIVQKSNSWPV